MSHSARELQEGIGQTGRLGEIFIGLGVLIFFYGIALWILSSTPAIQNSVIGGARAYDDLLPVWFFYCVMGVGFSVFGIMAVLAGWGRHHPDSSW
ncbi:MAG: hypothetical protein ACYDBQ_01495 [Thermoplasmatota archaeon]